MIVMEDMLKDFLLGEHLLLVGNQVSYGWNPDTNENVTVRVEKW